MQVYRRLQEGKGEGSSTEHCSKWSMGQCCQMRPKVWIVHKRGTWVALRGIAIWFPYAEEEVEKLREPEVKGDSKEHNRAGSQMKSQRLWHQTQDMHRFNSENNSESWESGYKFPILNTKLFSMNTCWKKMKWHWVYQYQPYFMGGHMLRSNLPT